MTMTDRIKLVVSPTEDEWNTCGFRGVTTILKATEPPEKKEALNNWRARTSNHAEILRNAIKRGRRFDTAVGRYVEFGTSKDFDVWKRVENTNLAFKLLRYWDKIDNFFQGYEVSNYQTRFISYGLGIRGIIDMTGKLGVTPLMIDMKTARKKRTRYTIYENPIQVCVYAVCFGYDHAQLVYMNDDLSMQRFTFRPDEVMQHMNTFMLRKQQYDFLKAAGKL